MICITYKNPDTEEIKEVRNGGTVPSGYIRLAVGLCSDEFLIQYLEKRVDKGAGNLMAVIAKPIAAALGREQCTRCEARRLSANAYKLLLEKHGRVGALTIIKDIWKLSSKDPNAALAELQKSL